MTTDKNKRALGQKLAVIAVALAVFTVSSVMVRLFASSHTWILTALLMGAIASLGVGGAFFIKASWTHIDESRAKSRWTILDSPLLN
jgi:hypothetical protein